MFRVLATVALLCATASASPTLHLTIEGTDVHASVKGMLKPTDAELVVEGSPNEPVRAHHITGMVDEPVGLQLVIAGQQLWSSSTANNEYDPYESSLFPDLVAAIDRLDLAKQLPAKSMASIVTYSTGAAVKTPWQPADSLHGDALGLSRDYKALVGSDLVHGVEQAIMNAKAQVGLRHIVIVIGDGNDTNNENAETLPVLAQLNPDITFVACVVRSSVSPETYVLDRLTSDIVEVGANYSGIEAALEKSLDIALGRFEATFSLSALPHDGKEHALTLYANNAPVATEVLEMPAPPQAPPPSKAWRYLVVLGVVAGFSLVSVLMFRKRR